MKQQTADNNRIHWIDMAKGIGMFLVMFGHMETGLLGRWIYSFHMPLFFFLSGYVFNGKYGTLTFVKKKLYGMVLPYFTLGTMLILFRVLYEYMGGELYNGFWAKFKQLLTQYRAWSLWFVAVLLVTEVMFYVIYKISSGNLLALSAIVLGLCGYGFYYYSVGGQALMWNADAAFTAVVFYYSGHLFKRLGLKLPEILDKGYIKCTAVILLFALNILFTYLSFKKTGIYFDMYYGGYGFVPFSFAAAFLGTAAVCILSSLIDVRYIRFVGRNTFLFLAWHQSMMIPLVLDLFFKAGFVFEGAQDSIFWCMKAAELVLVTLMLTPFAYVTSNTRLKYLIGKK